MHILEISELLLMLKLMQNNLVVAHITLSGFILATLFFVQLVQDKKRAALAALLTD